MSQAINVKCFAFDSRLDDMGKQDQCDIQRQGNSGQNQLIVISRRLFISFMVAGDTVKIAI